MAMPSSVVAVVVGVVGAFAIVVLTLFYSGGTRQPSSRRTRDLVIET